MSRGGAGHRCVVDWSGIHHQTHILLATDSPSGKVPLTIVNRMTAAARWGLPPSLWRWVVVFLEADDLMRLACTCRCFRGRLRPEATPLNMWPWLPREDDTTTVCSVLERFIHHKGRPTEHGNLVELFGKRRTGKSWTLWRVAATLLARVPGIHITVMLIGERHVSVFHKHVMRANTAHVVDRSPRYLAVGHGGDLTITIAKEDHLSVFDRIDVLLVDDLDTLPPSAIQRIKALRRSEGPQRMFVVTTSSPRAMCGSPDAIELPS